MSTIRLRRLQADYQRLQEYLRAQPRVRLVQAEGDPPERYQLEYQVQGLRQVDEQLRIVASHVVEIFLPLGYPRMAPQCRMLTPVFHPNIAPHAICIGDHWSAGEPLWSMVARIGEMIAYQSYNTKSPLNGEAARWVEANMARVPLDRVAMFVDERPAPAAARSAAPSAAGGPIPVVPVLPTRSASDAPTSLRAGTAPAPSLPTVAPLPPRPSSAAPAASRPAAASNPTRPRPAVAPASPLAEGGAAGAMLEITCPNCQAVYRAAAAMAGKRARCRRCQAIVEIPAG